jgi:hypothetical protein
MNSHFKCCLIGFLAFICSTTVGCGRSNYTPARASDPASARQALTAALDTWQSGAPSDSLASRTPTLFVRDEDWKAGHALKKYKLLGDGEPYGSNVRFHVGLELNGKSEQKSQKNVRYVVATDPVLSVTRDDRAE